MSLVSNTLKLSFAFVITKILQLFWNIYITRLFTDELDELGVYLFIITQFSIFSIIAEANISYSVQHFISIDQLKKNKAIDEYWTFSFISKLITSVLASLILFIVIIFQFPDYSFSAFLIAINLFVFTIGTSPNPLFICFDKFNPLVISNIINVLSFTVAGVILLYFFKDINYALIAMLIGNLLHTIYMLFHGFKDFGSLKGFRKLKNQLIEVLIKFSLPVGIFSFCSSLMYRVDFNIFGYFLDPQFIVYLGFATMCFFIMFDLLWGQLGVAMTPDLLRNWSSKNKFSRDKVYNQFEFLFVMFTILPVFVIIGLKFFGDYFFIILLGSDGDFFKIVPLLNNLILSTPFFLGFSFLYRIYLVEYSSLKIMIYSILFVFLKVTITYLLPLDILFQYSTLVTSIVLLLVCVLLMMMNTLSSYYLRILRVFLKSLLIMIALYFFSIKFETYDYIFINIILSITLIVMTLLFFRKNLKLFKY